MATLDLRQTTWGAYVYESRWDWVVRKRQTAGACRMVNRKNQAGRVAHKSLMPHASCPMPLAIANANAKGFHSRWRFQLPVAARCLLMDFRVTALPLPHCGCHSPGYSLSFSLLKGCERFDSPPGSMLSIYFHFLLLYQTPFWVIVVACFCSCSECCDLRTVNECVVSKSWPRAQEHSCARGKPSQLVFHSYSGFSRTRLSH